MNFLSRPSTSTDNGHVVLERPGLRALRPEIKSYIVFLLEEVNLLYAHYLINSQSIPLKGGRGSYNIHFAEG